MSRSAEVPSDHPFSLANIPWGVYKDPTSGAGRTATRYGDSVVDLFLLSEHLGNIDGFDRAILADASLTRFAALPSAVRRSVRVSVQTFLASDGIKKLPDEAVLKADDVAMLLPVTVGDYTDFCASEFHTMNAGRLMKVPGPPLPPAWSHLPIGYHGRASSVVVSGTPIRRPRGVLPGQTPAYEPTKTLDFEYELAAIVGGPGNKLGEPILIDDANDNIFGVVLMNDWSAREIQGFEMIPLGPFNGKNFATTISPWVVTLDALEPFKCALPQRAYNVETLPHLSQQDPHPNYDIQLELSLRPSGSSTATTIMRSNAKYLAFSLAQMLTHHSSSGCPMRAGDLLGSGTVSGPEPDSLACLLEICERGAKPLQLIDVKGSKQDRVWLEDGDEIVMTALCVGKAGNVGFGSCVGTVSPA